MPKEVLTPNSTERFSLDRCKAMADAVFAIVMTLLVLGIDIPPDHRFSEQGLIVFLERIGFDRFIYGVSFWLAGTYWILLVAIMSYFRQGSRALVWLNMLLLFPVTLLPFITELKGAYRHEALVTLLFGVVQILIGLALIALWRYAVSHPQLLDRTVEEIIRRKVTRRLFVSPIIISVIAVPLSFLSMQLSSLFFVSIPLYHLSLRAFE
ncbi:TMEM175 family protein [Methylohalobius crimeensis]|uniref:TMEM175 family protein n=1 Tax=Methylohalobius crimeensis TaxID=244365 RepID=UPI000A05A8D9|nr:TMEM175 family protein [Methylohalobius crimeensis]